MIGRGSEPGGPHRWRFSDEVAGFRWTAHDPRGVVLLQHGYGDHTTAYATRNNHLVPKLLEHRLSVYGFDMPGNGASPGARGATDAVVAVRLHRAARVALRRTELPTFLLGHSFGGLVTLTSAVADPANVAGLVLIAPGIKYDVNAFVRTVARVGARLAPARSGPMPAGSLESLTRVPDLQAEMASDPLMYLDRVRWLTLGSAAVMSHRNWRRYHQLRMPLLALHGTGDTNTDPSGSQDLIETASSSDKTLHLIPGARHALLDDLDRDRVTSLVLDWLDERTAASSRT